MVDTADHNAGPWIRRDWIALAMCVVVATLLSIAPHLATFVRYGTWEYVADGDEALYLLITKISYQGESAFQASFAGKLENMASVYPWLPFGPTGIVNRWLGLSLLASSVEWRLIGGLLLGSALFLMFRLLYFRTGHPTGWALGCSLVCLADAGFMHGATFVRSLSLLVDSWRGTMPFTKPDALPQYRVVSPLLMLPWLLLLVAAFLPATHLSVNQRKWKWALAGAVALGMCCNLYFYFWTGAVLALAGYIGTKWIAAWLHPEHRPDAIRASRHAAIVLAGGLALGAPQIYRTYELSRLPQLQPILERTCRAQHVPASDPFRRTNLINFWVWAKLVVGAIAILWFRFKGLGLLWWLVLSGYFLSNLAMVLGLEFENWHWVLVHAPMGEIMVLASCVFLLDRTRLQPKYLWAIPSVLVAIACFWRPYEALATPEAVRINAALRDLRDFRPTLATLAPGHLLAGPLLEADIASLFSKTDELYYRASLVPDEEAHTRYALNAWLQGLTIDQFRTIIAPSFSTCAFVNPAWKPEAVAGTRERIFRQFKDESVGQDVLNRYRPDYVLIPADVQPDSRIGPWRVLHQSSKWKLWARTH